VGWVAYVDESMRIRRSEPAVYVLAAAMFDDTGLDDVRKQVSELVSGPGQRFHWRHESRRLRDRAVSFLGVLPALHLVVIGASLLPSRQERGRRLCLERLLFELEIHGVAHVWMESRTHDLNAKDAAAVAAFRSQRVISHAIRVGHAYPSTEPLLWVPDIVAGTVTTAEAGERRWMDALAPLLTVHRVKLD
jgi:hypothetical protein